MLTEYIQAAMRYAEYKQYEDKSWFGFIAVPGFEGVWANESSKLKTEEELQSTLEDWLLLGIRLNHRLPEIGGIDLNAVSVAA